MIYALRKSDDAHFRVIFVLFWPLAVVILHILLLYHRPGYTMRQNLSLAIHSIQTRAHPVHPLVCSVLWKRLMLYDRMLQARPTVNKNVGPMLILIHRHSKISVLMQQRMSTTIVTLIYHFVMIQHTVLPWDVDTEHLIRRY